VGARTRPRPCVLLRTHHRRADRMMQRRPRTARAKDDNSGGALDSRGCGRRQRRDRWRS
jgi:hypothetical protein